MNRRAFIRSASALLAAGSVFGCGYAGARRRGTGLLVYGGGAAGIAAGLQAARMGTDVLVVEPSAWIGGKLTAAGVSALDGNKHGAGGGLVHEFREALAGHYGSYEALFTGWISLYCYEPHVGHRILQDLARPLPTLTVLTGADVVSYSADGEHRLVKVRTADDGVTEWACDVFVDATEYGDGLALAGLPYRLGREARDEYGESAAPEWADLEMQDLTYVATLVRDPDAPEPDPPSAAERAEWARFACSTLLDCADPDPDRLNHTIHGWDSFESYALLPNGKMLLNWPHHANDWPVDVRFFEDRAYRARQLEAARRHTLSFLRYMRTELGHPEWRLALDEYPTADHLPPIPYLRESRRLVTPHPVTQDDVVPVDGRPRAPMVPDAVAVGDYYLDHHHAKSHRPPGERLVEDYPDNAPFQQPLRMALTGHDERFLAAETNVSVTHIVNGCTRLQPAVMLMGQALGTLSALAIADGTAPGAVDVARVQETVIAAGCQVWPVYDVPTGHAHFAPVQRLALAGVLTDEDPLELDPDGDAEADVVRSWAARAGLPGGVEPEARGPLSPSDLSPALRPSDGPVTRGAVLAALDRSISGR